MCPSVNGLHICSSRSAENVLRFHERKTLQRQLISGHFRYSQVLFFLILNTSKMNYEIICRVKTLFFPNLDDQRRSELMFHFQKAECDRYLLLFNQTGGT